MGQLRSNHLPLFLKNLILIHQLTIRKPIAILFALQECHKHNINKKIIIYTDAQYCIDAITKWYDQWVKTDSLKNKKNVSFIQSIKTIMKTLDVSFIHIRGHTKKQDKHSIGNERADNLATSCL